jgi:hypothetical protein
MLLAFIYRHKGLRHALFTICFILPNSTASIDAWDTNYGRKQQLLKKSSGSNHKL